MGREKAENREYKDRSLSSTNKTDPSKKKGDTKKIDGMGMRRVKAKGRGKGEKNRALRIFRNLIWYEKQIWTSVAWSSLPTDNSLDGIRKGREKEKRGEAYRNDELPP